MEKITILQFTDPICVWCWGNEPVLRAVDYLYGDKVNIQYVMGGLVEDITTLYDLRGDKEEIIHRANQIIKKNWLAAAEKHGMPVVIRDAELFSLRYPSSFPQNIAYEATKRINPLLAKSFLRLLRETTFTESRRTSQIDVLIDLATRAGYDAAEFIDEYTTGNAHTDFVQDRMLCRRNGITGFPSYLIRYDSTEIIIGGYQSLSTFHTIIKRLSGARIRPRKTGPSVANIVDFIRRYKSVYPVEIETAFSLDRYQSELMIESLLLTNRIKAQSIGNCKRYSINDSAHSRRHSAKQKSHLHDIEKAPDAE